MMKKVNLKCILLIVLIVTSIIQTAMLWLGTMPSHNFLESATNKMLPILPESIWRNKGDPFTVSYRIDNNTGEYDRLVTQLSELVAKSSENGKIEHTEPLDWNRILAMKGLLFEYSIPVSLDEIALTKLGMSEVGFIDNIFLYMEDLAGNKVYLYLISERENLCYKMALTGEFGDLNKIYKAFNIEEVGNRMTKYQPSSKAINISPYIEGNEFLPLTSKSEPLHYEVLTLINPIEYYQDHKQLILDKYTNEFFRKPILKETEWKEDGSVVFTESMRSIVVYKPIGTIEYVNLNVSRTDKVMTMLEGYNIALNVISDAYSITETVKRNLYLSKIVQSGKEYTYYFDLRYGDYKVELSSSAKQELGMEHMAQFTIKDGQFIAGKWSIRELGFARQADERIEMGVIEESYSDPINRVYAQAEGEVGGVVIQDVEPIYVVESLDKQIEMKWGVYYDEMWHYP